MLSGIAAKLRKKFKRRPTVAVVRLSGVIASSRGVRGGGLSLAQLAEPLEQAFSLNKVKAVVLVINSPGGSPVQSSLIVKRIRALAKEKHVPVYAFAEDVAASGGYAIACAADEIYADENSILGSIGVVSSGFGFVDLIAKMGVERRIHTAGESKAMLDPFLPEREEDLRRLTDLQADVHAWFKDLVRERRGAKLSDSEDLFTGAFWAGRKAVELGLADGIGETRSVMREKFGEDVQLKVFGGQKAWWMRGVGQAVSKAMPAVSAQDWIEAAEMRGHWSRFGL